MRPHTGIQMSAVAARETLIFLRPTGLIRAFDTRGVVRADGPWMTGRVR